MDKIELDKVKYYNELVGKVYKLLPIYEGKLVGSTEKTIDPEQAFSNYQRELLLLSTRLLGDYELYNDPFLLEVISTLKGMAKFEVGQHTDVKVCVFGLIKKIKRRITVPSTPQQQE